MNNNDIEIELTPAEAELKRTMKEARDREKARKEKDRLRKEQNAEQFAQKDKKLEKAAAKQVQHHAEKVKKGLIGRVYENGSYSNPETHSQAVRMYHTSGLFLNRAAFKTYMSNGDLKEHFRKNMQAANNRALGYASVHDIETGNKSKLVGDFNGFEGLWKILTLAGTPSAGSSVFARLRVLGHYLNPANYLLFLSLALDEAVKDLAQVGLKEGETPGVMRMSVHAVLAFITGMQRFVVTSACKPLVYLMKSPKLFTALFLISVAVLNTMVYASNSDLNSDPHHKVTLRDLYHNLAAHIVDKIILPMLGTDKQDMTAEDRNQTIEALIGFLVQYSAVISASIASQLPKKSKSFVRGMAMVCLSEETRCLDGIHSIPDMLYSIPGAVSSCITSTWNAICAPKAPTQQAVDLGLHELGINVGDTDIVQNRL